MLVNVALSIVAVDLMAVLLIARLGQRLCGTSYSEQRSREGETLSPLAQEFHRAVRRAEVPRHE